MRERAGLSLDRVEALSREFADPIQKAYLSRCENGHQRTSFTKLIAWCRILDVAPEVLLERMDLDLEVERRGLATIGVTDDGGDASDPDPWPAYAKFRTPSAAPADPSQAVLFAATAAGRLGRNRFAMHELRWLERHGGLEPRFEVLLDDRLAVGYLRLRRYADADHYGERALTRCRALGLNDMLGPLCLHRALAKMGADAWHEAVALLQEALIGFTRRDATLDIVRCRIALATALLQTDRPTEARAVVQDTLERLRELRSERHLAKVLVLLGDVHDAEGSDDEAGGVWRKARRLALDSGESGIALEAELRLLRAARRENRSAAARSIERRIHSLWPKIVAHPDRRTDPGSPTSLAGA